MLKIYLAPLVLLFCFVQNGEADNYGFFKCPEVSGLDDFNITKFLGFWYGIEGSDPVDSCVRYNLTTSKYKNSYDVARSSEQKLLKKVFKHYYVAEGQLYTPQTKHPGNMKVQYHWSVGNQNFVVFDTDYEHYAGVFVCTERGFTHRWSAIFLSRETTLSDAFTEKLKKKMKKKHLQRDNLSAIKQSDCIKRDDKESFNVEIKRNSLSPKAAEKFIKDKFWNKYFNKKNDGKSTESKSDESKSEEDKNKSKKKKNTSSGEDSSSEESSEKKNGFFKLFKFPKFKF